MEHQLPLLPYALNALEPVFSKETLEFHYGKHHQAYVTNLNGLIKGTPFENATLETIIMEAEGPVFNNAAQIWNHTFYFEAFSPEGEGEPQVPLADAIARDFGSYETFRDQFSKAAATLFGSGWAWLVVNEAGKLQIVQESNAGNPMRKNLIPLLTCDVWEHAYYIDYRNRRPDYIAQFFKLVDWNVVEARYQAR